ncbi:MAG: AAA family ATPase [Nitrospira sp.]|nr:AAA family ATPase [Nitrospira sp.]
MAPDIKRIGQTIRIYWPEYSAALMFDRLIERSDGLHAEIQPVINGVHSAIPNLLTPFKANLLSAHNRKQVTTRVAENFRQNKIAIPVDHFVDQSIHWCIQTFRQGEPATLLDEVAYISTPFIINPIVLKNMPSVVFGLAARGKSYFALLACLLAETGQSLGALTVQRAHQTAYLDWELDRSVQGYRKQQILRAHPTLRTKGPLHRRMVRPLADDLPAVAKIIEANDVDFVVIDSLAPAAGGDQIGAEGAIRFFEALRILNVGCLILAHAPKPTENTKTKSIYGSVFFHNLARSVWEIETEQESDSNEIRMGLFHRKNNFGPKHSPFGLKLHFPLEEQDQEGGGLKFTHYDLVQDEELSKGLPLRKRIAHALENGQMTASQLAEQLDVPKNTIRARLSDGRGKYFVQLPGKDSEPMWGLLHKE